MAKRKKPASEKVEKVPRIIRDKQKQKISQRNSWLTTLSVVVLVTILALIWSCNQSKKADDITNTEASRTFAAKEGHFELTLPEGWVAESDEATVASFDPSLSNATFMYYFKPENSSFGTSTEIEIPVDSTILDGDDLTAKEKADLNAEIQKQVNIQQNDFQLPDTIITAAVFVDGAPETDIDVYYNGIGGLTVNPKNFYEVEIKEVGSKIPGCEDGYYQIREGGHPVAIAKKGDVTIVFNGIISSDEGAAQTKELFESIVIP
ncbi:MAG TPA: hypothetical protein PKV16_05145 [Caldisericia bacterium]|nr:hypothetical protein [Caldisericia bacterium]HPF48699.1 hypothetical protein [Caldisericia bacterium]HPI83641.1 hypothetical protein [Caldisericia bacterium]HPQ93154.1 hypothetical protein [Caldisericia bacterium]HRV75013.1 hypothetical protein [Caldisericia bacterium]